MASLLEGACTPLSPHAVPSCPVTVTGRTGLMSPGPHPPCFLFHSRPPGSSSSGSPEEEEEEGPGSGGARGGRDVVGVTVWLGVPSVAGNRGGDPPVLRRMLAAVLRKSRVLSVGAK